MLGVEILSRSENIDNSVNLCLGYIMVPDLILFFFFLIPSPERGRQKNISNEESSKEHH